ncbi:hypothetical protein BLNAU_17044 [Blattamonas nauphoetae]|uniref:Uncharacterized protein n=1 Tax=Blattamonas nauphoetae TaxID=2049346 RepID=A0ABQ9X7S1_9EUKA|nr:hypothetical protein BLNAU_17044 [Blattamonas nauphoetae]
MGGNVNLVDVCVGSSSLSINTCFFHKCTCMGQDSVFFDGSGGAVEFVSGQANPQTFSISDSSFTECSTGMHGGSLFLAWASPSSITGCFFELSTAGLGGALCIQLAKDISISNSAFVECSAWAYGGGIYTETYSETILSFLQFRECSTESYYDGDLDDGYFGHDIYFKHNFGTTFTADMIEFCDSTSARPNVFLEESGYDSTLVPHVTSTPTIKSVDVSFDGSIATVTVETEEAMKGTMGVLLDGSNVPRLVHVVFGKPWEESRIGRAVVSSGANGILPDDTTYTNRTTSFATDFFPPPTVRTADATLKDVRTIEIVLSGVSFSEEGSYWMLVGKEETEWNITLTRSDSTTLTGTASLSSSNGEVSLEWSTEYEVRRAVWVFPVGESSKDVKLPQIVTFTTPTETTPPFSSLTGVSAHIMKSDLESAVILLVFDREVSGSYDFVVEERGKDVTFTVVVESAGTTGETEEFVVVGDSRLLIERCSTRFTLRIVGMFECDKHSSSLFED